MPHSLSWSHSKRRAVLLLGAVGGVWMGLLLPSGLAAPPLAGLHSPVVFQLHMHATINSLEDRLEISENRPLSFGSFLPVASGSITITPEGAVSFSGEFASQTAFHEGDHNAGELALLGIAHQPVHLEVFSAGALEGPGEAMSISQIALIDAQGNRLASGSSLHFDDSGQANLRYGATLSFVEAQAPGVYTGETQITMNY